MDADSDYFLCEIFEELSSNFCGGFSTLEVKVKGKLLQESKVKTISTGDAAELVEHFYYYVVKNGLLVRSTDIYQGWLNQQDDNYVQDYFSIILRSAKTLPEMKRQNCGAEEIGSICVGYYSNGFSELEDNIYYFSTPSEVTSGKIANTQVCWSYDISACTQYTKLKHVFKLYFNPDNTSEWFYIALCSTYDLPTLGKLAISFAFDVSKGLTGTNLQGQRTVHPPVCFERPQVKNVLPTDVQCCLDVVVALFALEHHLVQVFWKSVTGSHGYLDPISSLKQADGTEILRVKLPNLEQEKQVWLGVKAKYFDDLYSNIVMYNEQTFTAQRYITPSKAYYPPTPHEWLITPAQYPLHINNGRTVPLSPPCSDNVAINALTPLQSMGFLGCTRACAYVIKSQLTKLQVEDTFAVVSCAMFSGNMRTFIVCQAFHMWNVQLVPKESLLDLLHLVMNHDYFSQSLDVAEMLGCLPRELQTEKHLATLSRLFTDPFVQNAQQAFNQLNFIVSQSNNNSTQTPSTQLLQSVQIPQIPQIPQLHQPPPLQLPLASPQCNDAQKLVSYEVVYNLLFNPKINSLEYPNYSIPKTLHSSTSFFVQQPAAFFTSPQDCNVLHDATPTHLMVASNTLPSQAITLAMPIQPYQLDDSLDPQPKRARTSYNTSAYLQCKRNWKNQRTSYPELPTLSSPSPDEEKHQQKRHPLHVQSQQTSVTQPYILPQSISHSYPPLSSSHTSPTSLAPPPIPTPLPSIVIPQPVSQPQQPPLANLDKALLARQRADLRVQCEAEQLPNQQQDRELELHKNLNDSELVEKKKQHEIQQELVEPVQTDKQQEKLEKTTLRQASWQQRRHKRKVAFSFANETNYSADKKELHKNKKNSEQSKLQIKWKLSKTTSIEPISNAKPSEPISPITDNPDDQDETSKKRALKRKREKDEDYEEIGEEEEEEEEDDDEYDELPMRRRRIGHKRRCVADTLHKPPSSSKLMCACKICKYGLPSSCQNPSWVDIAILTITCLSQTSRTNARCFNLQTEMFPFIEKHYSELVKTNVHRNSWKKKIQSVLSNAELFVCVKQDKSSCSSELWALCNDKDPWDSYSELSPSTAPSTPQQDSDGYDSDEMKEKEFAEEMTTHWQAMREQLQGAKNQRDLLATELNKLRKDILACTDSLYNLVGQCAMAHASPDFGAKFLDEIFENIFEDIHKFLGESTTDLILEH